MSVTDKYKYENVKKFVNSVSGYELLTEKNDYKNSNSKIRIKHSCGNEFLVSASHFIVSNNRCPKCNKAKYFPNNKGIEKFKKDVFDIVGNEYTVIGDYVNKETKIALLHNKCGNIYNVTPGHFLNTGCRCTYCRQTSRGETNIKFLLEQNNIDFTREYTFSDLWNEKHTSILEFDFAIFRNDKLICLIEFDGIQHFQPIFPAGGSEEEKQKQFETVQKNDNRKNSFCKEHNIPLYRIDYKHRDKKKMQGVIDKILGKLNDYPETEYTKK